MTIIIIIIIMMMMIIITPWSSPSWEVNWASSSQEFSRNLWNKQVCHPLHKSPLHVPFLSQINPAHAQSHFLEVHFNILTSTTRSSILSLSFGIPQQNYITYLINNVKNYRFTSPNIPEDRRSPLHRGRSLTSLSGLFYVHGTVYTVLSSWWWAEDPPETCRTFIVINTIV
jgi:hypothetical protein